MSAPVFLLLAVLLVAAALTVVAHPSPVYSACALVLTLFVLSVLFVGLDAQLVAVAVGGGLAIVALVASALRRVPAPSTPGLPEGFGETAALARRLFTAYLLPFELTSVLLLVAIVGAVALAKRRV